MSEFNKDKEIKELVGLFRKIKKQFTLSEKIFLPTNRISSMFAIAIWQKDKLKEQPIDD